MQNKKILTVLADGFEEIEAVAVIDILRRLGVEVCTATLFGTNPVCGAHGMKISADIDLAQADASSFDAVFLPGGMPGSKNLRDSAVVIDLLHQMNEQGKVVSAICAAPIALAAAGLLKDRRFTMYPGFEAMLGGAKPTGTPAEIDGNIVTGKGPGCVFAFAKKLASALGLADDIAELYCGMFVEK